MTIIGGLRYNPVWSILLSGTTAISHFSFPLTVDLLNSRGFYEILVPEEPGTLKTIQLLINSTQRNNGTLVKCNDVVSPTLFSETNLIVIGKNNNTMHFCRCRTCRAHLMLSFQSPLLCSWIQLTFTCKPLTSHGAL